MPCRTPLTGYRTPDGSVTFTDRQTSMGRFGLFTARCGVCRDCRLHRAREWAIRCYHESQMHRANSFLTLTFAQDPASVSKRDLQLFFKRLRKALPNARIRYFAVGEYGEQFSRPHYHVCLFGHDFPDKYPWIKSPRGNLQYRSPTLEKCWKHGHALIGELTMESAGYTARYCLKKITGDLSTDHYKRDFRGVEINIQPEFQLASIKPAIGLGWIEKNWQDVFRNDHVVYKGKICPVPSYYSRWLEKHHPEKYEQISEQRKNYYAEQTYESGKRLHQAAEARDAKTETLRRNYESPDRPQDGRTG